MGFDFLLTSATAISSSKIWQRIHNLSVILFLVKNFVVVPLLQNMTEAIHIQIASMHKEKSCATFMSQ